MIPVKIPAIKPELIPASLPDWLPVGCKVWYAMNEGAGLGLIDSSGNGIAGTFGAAAAAPSWVAGPREGSVLSFDGGDYVSLSLAVAGYNHTVEFWAAPTLDGAARNLFDCQTGRKQIVTEAAGTIRVYDGSGRVFARTFVSDAWVHIVFALPGAGTPIQYANAVPVASVSGLGETVIGGLAKLGTRYDATSGFYLGLMGCFRVYDRVLSQAEVSALFAQDRARYGI